MALTIKDWQEGDSMFFGSRWHRVTGVRVKGEPRSGYTSYTWSDDAVTVACGYGNYGVWSAGKYHDRVLPTDTSFRVAAGGPAPNPRCGNCWQNGRGIPLSAISDPELADKIRRRLKSKTQYRWEVYDDATE